MISLQIKCQTMKRPHFLSKVLVIRVLVFRVLVSKVLVSNETSCRQQHCNGVQSFGVQSFGVHSFGFQSFGVQSLTRTADNSTAILPEPNCHTAPCRWIVPTSQVQPTTAWAAWRTAAICWSEAMWISIISLLAFWIPSKACRFVSCLVWSRCCMVRKLQNENIFTRAECCPWSQNWWACKTYLNTILCRRS